MTNRFAPARYLSSLSLFRAMAVMFLFRLVLLNPAAANPIVYTLIPPVTAGGDITVIGGFTFDPATTALDAVDLEVTGGPQPGSYTQPIEGFAAAISASIPGSDMDLVMSFQNDLGTVPDPVSKILFLIPKGMNMAFVPAAGEAVPANAAPEPASLALLGGAVGCFILMRRAHSRGRAAVRASRRAA